MNRKVLALFVALMAAAILATPGVAKTEKVSASMALVVSDELPADYRVLPNGEILQGRGGGLGFLVTLEIGNSLHEGVLTTVYHDMTNLKTQTDNIHYRAVLTLDGSEADGFAGNIQTKVSMIIDGFPDNIWESDRCVLQGFGIYNGQTLVLGYDGLWPFALDAIYTWEGYCLKG